MAKVKYIISRTDIENTPKIFIYSDFELYHTIRIGEDGKETFNGDVSSYMIRNGVNGIPSFELDKWIDAVESFIYDHNDKVNAEKGFNVKFNITSVDSRDAYTYEEIVNGKVVKSGVGWGLDFDTQVETDAWMDAVIEYNKANGIKMPSDKIKEKLNKLKESIKALDNELPEDQGFELPMISVVLPSLDSDPCEFVSKVKEASENVVATIGGMPSPKDIINHNIKIVKKNIYTTTARTYDGQTKFIEPICDDMDGGFQNSIDYWKEADAYIHQMAKEEEECVVYFETVVEPPIKYEPIHLVSDRTEPSDDDVGKHLPAANIPTIEISDSDKALEYKEVTYLNIYAPRLSYGTSQENYIARFHVGEAMQNLWVPIRKGWQEYAIKTLHINPEWHISSGYRPEVWNRHVRGADNSAHKYGYAIDVQLSSFRNSNDQKRTAAGYLSAFIKYFLLQNKHIQFDQIIIEHDKSGSYWVHIGYKTGSGSTRRQFWPNYLKEAKSGHHGKYETL